jgi:hypothetical protein
MRWAGHAARVEEMKNFYKILVGIPEGKRPVRRSKHRREDNIRVDIRKIDWECVNWIRPAHNNRDQRRALVNTVMNIRVP